jgi:hypothetical protein
MVSVVIAIARGVGPGSRSDVGRGCRRRAAVTTSTSSPDTTAFEQVKCIQAIFHSSGRLRSNHQPLCRFCDRRVEYNRKRYPCLISLRHFAIDVPSGMIPAAQRCSMAQPWSCSFRIKNVGRDPSRRKKIRTDDTQPTSPKLDRPAWVSILSKTRLSFGAPLHV